MNTKKEFNGFKKIIVASVASLALFSSSHAGTITSSFPADLGVGFATDMGFGFTAQIDHKINISLGSAGIASDYLLLDNKINANFNTDVIEKLSWYVGVGAGYYWSDWVAESGDADIRIPIGVDLDLDFDKKFDVYLQLAPALRIGDTTKPTITGAFGARYFF